MTYLRTWKKGKRLYFALVRTRRIKRGAKKGKVVQEVVRYIGTTKDLYEFIEDAENKIRLEDVSVTNVLEYGPIVLLHKIAAMIAIVSHTTPYIISHYNVLCNKKWLKFPQG